MLQSRGSGRDEPPLELRRLARNVGLVERYQAAAFAYASVPFFWFLLRERGFGFAEFTELQSIYYGTTLACELPTGLLADRVGRRPVLALAVVAQACGFAVMAGAHSFVAFAAVQVLLGLGQAMLSGTTSAMLYDSLRALGRETEYLHCESRAIVSRLVGTSLAFLAGGALAGPFGLTATPVASMVFSLAALPVALAMREPPREIGGAAGHTPVRLLVESVRDVARVPDLRWVAVTFAALFVALRTAFCFYSPGLERAGVEHYATIGGVYAALNVVAAGATRATRRVTEEMGERASLIAILGVLALSFAALAATTSPALAVLCFFVQQVPFGLHFPIVAAFVNRRVSSHRRATTLSILSLLGRASFAAAFPALGLVETRYGLSASLWVAAAAFAVATAALGAFGRRGAPVARDATRGDPG